MRSIIWIELALNNPSSVCLVLTSPFAVNGFLLNHLTGLADIYAVTLVVNTKEYSLSPNLDSRVEVVHLDIQRRISPWLDLLSLIRLISFFSSRQFSMVHTLTPKAGLLGMLAAFICRIPVRIHTFTGQVWATRRGIARRGLKGIDKLIAGLATRVLTDSYSQLEFLLSEGVVGYRRIGVAGPGSISGVDPERFKPSLAARERLRTYLGIPESAVVFLALGRINREKGVIDLVDAFCSVAPKNPSAFLVIAGPDEGGLANFIVMRGEWCSENVKVVPRVVKAEDYLAASDVLVVPSYREGFGTVVLEGAACGIPTIASRIYGLTDAVIDNVTGIFFPAGNVVELAKAITRLILNADERMRLGGAARARALADFSAHTITNAWLAEYKRNLATVSELNK